MEWLHRLLRGDKTPPPPAWDELVELARSPDGRQRQAAVRALATSAHAPALPVLLERLNDWVEPIRGDARLAVDNFLRDEMLDAWIVSLAGVAALTRGGRDDHTGTLGRIVDWLLAPHRLARLRVAPVVVPRAVERLLFRAQMRSLTETGQQLQVWRDALRSSDIALAGDAAEALRAAAVADVDRDAFTRPMLIALARRALGSRFSGIRLTGLRTALSLAPEEGRLMAHALCFDRNASARALAIATLRDDAAATATLATQAFAGLDSSRTALERATALDALCALDEPRGLAACRALQADRVAAVRAVALRRLLAGATSQERDTLVEQALADESSRVRRIAVAQVHRGASPPSAQALAALCVARPAALGSLLAVASHLPPWQRFVLLLDRLRTFEPATPAAGWVLAALETWAVDMARTHVAPSAAQVDASRHAWAAGRDLLPRSLQDQVAFHLRSFGVLAG